jgi:hypothetical protein
VTTCGCDHNRCAAGGEAEKRQRVKEENRTLVEAGGNARSEAPGHRVAGQVML